MEQMEKNLMEKFEKQEKQLDEIYKTVRRLKKYFLTTIIISVLTFLLPVLAVILSLPWLMQTFETLTRGSLL